MLEIKLVYAGLLAIVARKLGYDALVLTHDYTKQLEQNIKRDTAMLMSYGSYYTVPLLKADDSTIEVEYLDYSRKHLRDAVDAYKELVVTLYRILDNGGVLKANYDLECNEKSEKSGGSIAAADVPEFMIKCVLHNLV